MPLVTTAELRAQRRHERQRRRRLQRDHPRACRGHRGGRAARAPAPVILQVSENTVAFHGTLRPISAALAVLAADAAVPVGLHLDHVEAPAPLGAGGSRRVLVGDGRRRRPAL